MFYKHNVIPCDSIWNGLAPVTMAVPANGPAVSRRNLSANSVTGFVSVANAFAFTAGAMGLNSDGAGGGGEHWGRSPAPSQAHNPTPAAAVPQCRRHGGANVSGSDCSSCSIAPSPRKHGACPLNRLFPERQLMRQPAWERCLACCERNFEEDTACRVKCDTGRVVHDGGQSAFLARLTSQLMPLNTLGI